MRPELPPNPSPDVIVLSGTDFARGGAALELSRKDGGWLALWTQDLARTQALGQGF